MFFSDRCYILFTTHSPDRSSCTDHAVDVTPHAVPQIRPSYFTLPIDDVSEHIDTHTTSIYLPVSTVPLIIASKPIDACLGTGTGWRTV